MNEIIISKKDFRYFFLFHLTSLRIKISGSFKSNGVRERNMECKNLKPNK